MGEANFSDLSDCVQSHDYAQAVEKWKNESFVWENRSYFYFDFVCRTVRYEWTKEQCESTEARLVLALAMFGFFGSLMSILTFCRRPFVATDVYLYRTVGVFECIQMLVMACMHSSSLFDCHSSYICTFFSAHIYMFVTNLCAEAVEFIVVFLCIERTIACLAPQHFHKIHNLSAYRIVAIFAVVTSLPLNFVHSFDMKIEIDDEDARYRETPSWFASTSLYTRVLDAQLIRFCLVAPTILVATAGSIVGLWQAAKRKRRLRGDGKSNARQRLSVGPADKKSIEISQDGQLVQAAARVGAAARTSNMSSTTTTTTAADRTRKEIKQMIDLCCLQLCLAIPIVINYLLCMAERAAKWNIIIADRHKIYEEAFGTMTYDEACTMISRATVLEYLRLTISLTHMMAHGLHFYLYISFSAKFRQTLCEWWHCLGKCACHPAIRSRMNLLSRRYAYREPKNGNDKSDYVSVPTSSTVAHSPYRNGRS